MDNKVTSSGHIVNDQNTEFYKLYEFQAPDWALHLRNIPTEYVKLSNLNTPIHKWNLQDLPEGFEVFIKRDDLTGSELSGSKIRSLQCIFGDILKKGSKHVVTGGGHQSNFCRSVSIICSSLGLKPHVVIGGVWKKEKLSSKGDALLYRLAGSKVYLPPKGSWERFKQRIIEIQQYVSESYNEECYQIPAGGASVRGVFGYLMLFQELLNQGLHERFDDIIVTLGSGGTTLGLAVGNYLTGSKLRIHAVTCGNTKEAHCSDMDKLLVDMGLERIKSADIVDIVEGYIGEKYGTCTDQVLEFITKVSSTTGILLNPYYTAKGTMGMLGEMKANPSRFKGTRVLFLHTGGIFGLFNGEMERIIGKQGDVTAGIIEECEWPVDEKIIV